MPVFSPLFFFTRWSWFSPSKGHRGSLQIHFLKKACSLEVRFFFSIVTLWSFVFWRKDGKTRHVMKKKRKAIQHATLGYTKNLDQFYLYIYNNDDEAEESSTTALLRIFLTSKTTIFQNVTSWIASLLFVHFFSQFSIWFITLRWTQEES